jgi:hypothetical protein
LAGQNRDHFLILHEQRNEVLLLGIAIDNDFVPVLRMAQIFEASGFAEGRFTARVA